MKYILYFRIFTKQKQVSESSHRLCVNFVIYGCPIPIFLYSSLFLYESDHPFIRYPGSRTSVGNIKTYFKCDE